MIVGVPKEIKSYESRVSLVPELVQELVSLGHQVIVESGAGEGIGIDDYDYTDVGAVVVDSAQEVYEKAKLIVKVKEPLPEELPFLHEEHILFGFLHLAANFDLAQQLMESGCTAIGYETVTDSHQRLPLLRPMSMIAGRLSIQVASHYLESPQDGRGVLLSGIPGVKAGHIVVIGAGVAGTEACRVGLNVGADVTVFDTQYEQLYHIDQMFNGRVKTCFATESGILSCIDQADCVIGSVLLPGKLAPKVISERIVQAMPYGSVLVDIAIDQGGCAETSRPTSHDDPTYEVHGVTHYAVTNMPAAVASTSTYALCYATFPYVKRLANEGLSVLDDDPGFMQGLNIQAGQIVNPVLMEQF